MWSKAMAVATMNFAVHWSVRPTWSRTATVYGRRRGSRRSIEETRVTRVRPPGSPLMKVAF